MHCLHIRTRPNQRRSCASSLQRSVSSCNAPATAALLNYGRNMTAIRCPIVFSNNSSRWVLNWYPDDGKSISGCTELLRLRDPPIPNTFTGRSAYVCCCSFIHVTNLHRACTGRLHDYHSVILDAPASFPISLPVSLVFSITRIRWGPVSICCTCC